MDDVDLALGRALLEGYPAEAARRLEEFEPDEAAGVLLLVSAARGAGVVERMVPVAAAGALAAMPAAAAARVLAELDLDSAVALLRRMPAESAGAVLGAAPREVSEPLRTSLAYPEGTAGALMDPTILAAPVDVTVGEALGRVRRSPRHAIYYLYLVERGGRLAGVVSLRDLMLAEPGARVGEVARPGVVSVPATAERAAIVAHPGWTEFHALPVVDGRGAFVGAVRYETMRRLETEEHRASEHPRPVSMALSLAELYWMGLSGLLEGLGHAASRGGPDGG